MNVRLSLLMLKMAEATGSSHSRSAFLILVVDPNIDRTPSRKVLPLKRKCCFSAGPVAFYDLLACNCKVCRGVERQFKAIKRRGSSRSEETINERGAGHQKRATKDLMLVEENVPSATTAATMTPNDPHTPLLCVSTRSFLFSLSDYVKPINKSC